MGYKRLMIFETSFILPIILLGCRKIYFFTRKLERLWRVCECLI